MKILKLLTIIIINVYTIKLNLSTIFSLNLVCLRNVNDYSIEIITKSIFSFHILPNKIQFYAFNKQQRMATVTEPYTAIYDHIRWILGTNVSAVIKINGGRK